jgi:eukaryotic-like serine/threonine-protein kinase
MSRKRPPAPPPVIDGFEYLSLIGSGGFSDVFLYQQRRPRRRVAVKVLLHEWTGEGQRAAFDAEADLMATLSTHPSIVTMYQADVAEDGRPYLAMEYCSRPSLGARYRSERMSVPDVLRIAVQVAGAVETAHRSDILHRDIKPANVLVTEYGHPALTDFGISSTLDDATRAEGMSIPWSPPESFADPPVASVATDVWGLAATTYSLLAGRSPFEVPGGSNSSADLVARVESAPLPPTGRTDVPASLERVLAVAMAKSPAARYPTVLAFARALQQVQAELSYAVTPIDLLDDEGHVLEEAGPVGGPDALVGAGTGGTGLGDGPDPDDEDVGTRLREVVSVDPRGPGASVGPRPPNGAATPAGAWAASGRTGQSPTAVDDPGDTVHRSPLTSPSETEELEADDADAPRRTRTPLVASIAGAAAVVAVILAVVLWPGAGDPGGADPTAPASTSEADLPVDNLDGVVPPVADLAGVVNPDGTVTFTWSSPDVQDGDSYAWRQPQPLEDPPFQQVDEPTKTVPAAASGQTCIEVVIVRDGAPSYEPRGVCVP